VHCGGRVCHAIRMGKRRRREGKDEDDSFGADGVEFARYRTNEKRGLLGPRRAREKFHVCVGSVTCSRHPMSAAADMINGMPFRTRRCR